MKSDDFDIPEVEIDKESFKVWVWQERCMSMENAISDIKHILQDLEESLVYDIGYVCKFKEENK